MSSTTTSSSVSLVFPVESDTHTAFGMAKEDHLDSLRKDLKNFCKCVKGNIPRFLALTDFGGIDGFSLDSQCCKPVGEDLVREVLRDFLQLIDEGNFKFNGKKNDWSIGFMGSRWLDMDATSYGVDYIRVAFYSKRLHKETWESEKPYSITVTVEKAR